MFENIIEMVGVPEKIEAHGKKFIVLKPLRDGWFFCREDNAESPAPVVIVKDPNYEKALK